MINLDNIEQIKKLDQENILQNIQDFPMQIEKCWDDWKTFALPTHYINAKQVVILGMGGSGIGAALIASLAESKSKIPVFVCRDYNLPAWVDKNTLVIAVSYSGNTEETVTAFGQAGTKTDKLIAISTGGKVATLASQFRVPHYRIDYGSQPRVALGYSFTALLAIFTKLHFIEISENQINEGLILLKGYLRKIDIDIPSGQNAAKLLARKIYEKIPIILGSGTLTEVARRFKGDFNENAKNASYFETIPEMNHNALVGLEFPKDLNNKLYFIILQSNFDQMRNKLRQNIVTQILQQRRIGCETIMIQPTVSEIDEIWQMILLSDFTSYYLAVLNNVAPEPVNIISFLKDKLAEVPFERS